MWMMKRSSQQSQAYQAGSGRSFAPNISLLAQKQNPLLSTGGIDVSPTHQLAQDTLEINWKALFDRNPHTIICWLVISGDPRVHWRYLVAMTCRLPKFQELQVLQCLHPQIGTQKAYGINHAQFQARDCSNSKFPNQAFAQLPWNLPQAVRGTPQCRGHRNGCWPRPSHPSKLLCQKPREQDQETTVMDPRRAAAPAPE